MCKHCGEKHYIYKSCGNSQCMLCQSIKREQWMDRLKKSLLKVPYVHCVFTLPHQLNGLAKGNPEQIYSIMLKAAWHTVRTVFEPLHASPGMTCVLHTFGSDLKYHVHTHALVTFGGLDKNGKWVYPTDKYKIARYRAMCSGFKTAFLKELSKAYSLDKIIYHVPYEKVEKEVKMLRWVVHTTRPTMEPAHITNYLARYINRVAVSQSRIKLVEDSTEVVLLFNDYKNQKENQPAPKAILHLDALVAINQILAHVLPRHFQKARSYGIHNSSSKIKKIASLDLLDNTKTIRTLFQILTALLGLEKLKCSKCQSECFTTIEVKPDYSYISQYIPNNNKSPPADTAYSIKPKKCSLNAYYSNAQI